jgi:hypothetical protein
MGDQAAVDRAGLPANWIRVAVAGERAEQLQRAIGSFANDGSRSACGIPATGVSPRVNLNVVATLC